MKKLLIIQQDEAYFLFETIQVLEKNLITLKDFDLTILVDAASLKTVYGDTTPVIKGLTTSTTEVQEKNFDISVNLSLNEKSWDLHGAVKSENKLGVYRKDGNTLVDDLWSTYLLTLKAKAPFLTFHLQDVYKNILGLKGISSRKTNHRIIKQIAFGMSASHLFSPAEQEIFIQELSLRYPSLSLKDISEIDLVDDVSQTLYIGPATLNAIQLCEAGGKGIFLSTAFQGFNLLPYEGDHLFLSSRGTSFTASKLIPILENEMSGKKNVEGPYSIFRIDHDTIHGAYLKSVNQSDDNYPFYQSHVVLWNFLLNLHDANLEITTCTQSQIKILQNNQEVLSKVIRLHDYAMESIDTVYRESKAALTEAGKISDQLKNLEEIEKLLDQISSSHVYLRPVLDFYHIRRGQNNGTNLTEQSQICFLTYAEEHQALEALSELFSVTLKKNEATI